MAQKAPHAILRFAKHKAGPAGALEAHHERTKEQYASNPDIDTSRSKDNFHIIQPAGKYRRETDRRIRHHVRGHLDNRKPGVLHGQEQERGTSLLHGGGSLYGEEGGAGQYLFRRGTHG